MRIGDTEGTVVSIGLLVTKVHTGVAQEPPPFVVQTALSDFYVEYRLCAQGNRAAPRRRVASGRWRATALHHGVPHRRGAAGSGDARPHRAAGGHFDQMLDVEGDRAAAFAAGLAAGVDARPDPIGRLENGLHEWRSSNHDSTQAQGNARAHYGLPEAFYRLWLDDPLKLYTCAYWPEGTATLEQAQRQKIDHVCRKIRLGPDDRFADVGCGFAGFMLRAAQTTGASGVGINTTPEQVR